MQEENNDIDNFFRDNLEKFEANPPERVWTSIAGELDKKKKPGGFWLLGIFLLAGIISLGSYEYFRKGSETSGTNKEKQVQVPTESAVNNSENKKPISPGSIAVRNAGNESEKKIAAPLENREAPIKKTSLHGPEAKHNTTDKNIAFSQTSAVSVSDFTPAGQKISSAKKPVNAASSQMVENTVITSTQTAEVTDQKVSPTSENISAETTKVAEESTAHENKVENSPMAQSTIPVPPMELDKSQTTSGSEQAVADKVDEKPVLENPEHKDATTPVVAANATVAELPAAEKSDAPSTPVKTNLLKRIGSHLNMGLFYSPDYTDERRTGTQNATQTDHGNSWSSGLKLGYEIGSKWSISSGISYSRFSKTDTYSSVYVSSDSAFFHTHHGDGDDEGDDEGDDHEGGPAHNGNHYVLHTNYGDYDLTELPEESTGDENSGDTISQVSEVVSSVTCLNIPLKVRYNLRSRKLGYYVEAGALMSYVVSSNSKINTGNHIENGPVKGLKKNYYSALLNLGIEYRFYKGLALFFEPNLRYSFTPLLEKGSEKSFPYFIGGNLGLSIHF